MTTPLERRAHVAGQVARPAPAPRSAMDRQIDAVLRADPWITSRAQARRRIESGERAAADAEDPEPAPRERDVTAAAATVPGSLIARKQQQKVKPPKRSDYERGSNEDRAGNRGH